MSRRRSGEKPLPDTAAREQRAVALVFAIGMFMSILDTQIVNVALSQIGRAFDAPTSTTQWLVSGYLLSLAVFVPIAGWLGDRFGTRRVYLVAIAVFASASAVAALSPTLEVLIGARVVQGVGGGMLLPLGQTVLYRAYGPAERVRVARSISRVIVIAPATAPIIGGLLITKLSWHWIFLINVPIGLIQFCFAYYALTPYRAPERARFDALGAVLGGGGLSAFLYALSQGPTQGWTSLRVLVCGAVAVAALSLFAVRELRIPQPVLKLTLLGDRMLRRACTVVTLITMAFFGCILFTPLYLQRGLGTSALQSGLTTFPCAVGIGVGTQVVARLYPRVGPRRLMMAGFTGVAVMGVVLSTNGAEENLWAIRGEMFMFGLFVPCVMFSTQASAFARISHADTSHAASIFTSIQRSASALGVGLLTSLLGTAAGAGTGLVAEDFRNVYLGIAAFASVGILAAARVRDADAAETMVVAPRGNSRFRARARRTPDAVAAPGSEEPSSRGGHSEGA